MQGGYVYYSFQEFYFLFNFYIYSICILHCSTCFYKDSFKELIYVLWSLLLCRLNTMLWFSSSSFGVYLRVAIQNDDS